MKDIQKFDYSVNLLRSLIWQYDNTANLRGILEKSQEWHTVNQQGFWENWLTDVFDLRTANEFGLSVWSIILGQSLYTNFVPTSTGPSWGFGVDNLNFENGNFANQGGTNIYSLSISRLLLQLRYFQLTSSGTLPETNRMLKYLFADYGDAYVVDNQDMTITYMFDFAIPAEMSYIFNNIDILPRPACVKASFVGL